MNGRPCIRREYVKSSADEALDRAIKRIYEVYGPNLNAFFNDVQKDIEKRRKKHDSKVQ